MARYGALFVIVGVATALYPLALGGGAWWALAWPGGGFVAVGLAYALGAHRVFGKRADGTLAPLRVVALAPYLGFTWAVWHAVRRLGREPATTRLAPALVLARRLLPGEVPDDVAVIVDLTAEFVERAGVTRGRRYVSLPILDGGVPGADAVAATIASLPATTPVLIHCAQGHGRTAMVAACVLLDRGEAATAGDAVERILAVRPGARMSRSQRAFVEAYARARLDQTSRSGNGGAP